MIKIYGYNVCPDCAYIAEQVAGNPEFEECSFLDSTAHLKTFLKLREVNPIFDDIRAAGGIGIPCFVLEDGTVTLTPEDVGLKSRPADAE